MPRQALQARPLEIREEPRAEHYGVNRGIGQRAALGPKRFAQQEVEVGGNIVTYHRHMVDEGVEIVEHRAGRWGIAEHVVTDAGQLPDAFAYALAGIDERIKVSNFLTVANPYRA